MNADEKNSDTREQFAESPRQAADARNESGAGPREPEPITLPMLGRLFGVPLLIVSVIVGGAVVVVLMFGAPSTREHQSVADLLQKLEASSGEKSAGLLLPREKELWLAALELTQRLEKKDSELTEDELGAVTRRLRTLVEVDLESVEHGSAASGDGREQRDIRTRRLEFVIHALGRTQRPEAVEALVDIVRSNREPYARVAMHELGNLREIPETREAVEPIVTLLRSDAPRESLLTGCTALSVIAAPDDERATEVLNDLRLSHEGEVAWSAALALARLRSSAGKSTLMDLLDRSFWESGERYETQDASGRVLRYKMPPSRIEALLVAAMEAAANLDDPDLWECIGRLKSDPSTFVRGRALEVLAGRTQG